MKKPLTAKMWQDATPRKRRTYLHQIRVQIKKWLPHPLHPEIQKKFDEYRLHCAQRTPEENMAFIDALEAGTEIIDPKMREIADFLRAHNYRHALVCYQLNAIFGERMRELIRNYRPKILQTG